MILDLIDAAVAFAAAEPWHAFGSDEPLAIRIDSSRRELEGCVLGSGGQEFGLALYHQPGSMDRVHAFVEEGRPEAARSLACTTADPSRPFADPERSEVAIVLVRTTPARVRQLMRRLRALLATATRFDGSGETRARLMLALVPVVKR